MFCYPRTSPSTYQRTPCHRQKQQIEERMEKLLQEQWENLIFQLKISKVVGEESKTLEIVFSNTYKSHNALFIKGLY